MDKPRVLFLCTGNSARSQMAEALLKKYAKDNFEIFSAGLEPKEINPLTLKVLDEAGLNTEGQYAKPLSTYLGKTHFSYLITVCSNAEDRCPIFPGMGKRMHWPFDDPAEFNGNEKEKLEKFRETRDQIETRILTWLEELGISLPV
jgi:arsenate reductase